MSFMDSIRTCLTKYAVFSGRARRSEFWFFALFLVAIEIVAGIIDAVIGISIVELLVVLATLLPSLAVSVRRLHDTDRSGWWILLGLIPVVGTVVLIVFYSQDSKPESNTHGPSPKGGYPNVSGQPYGSY